MAVDESTLKTSQNTCFALCSIQVQDWPMQVYSFPAFLRLSLSHEGQTPTGAEKTDKPPSREDRITVGTLLTADFRLVAFRNSCSQPDVPTMTVHNFPSPYRRFRFTVGNN